MVRDQISPRKPPGSRLGFSRTRVQHSPSSSTMEQLSTLAEFVAYSPLPSPLPYRTGNGTLACAAAPYQAFPDSATPASSLLPPHPEGHQIGAREEAHRVDTITSSTPTRLSLTVPRLPPLYCHLTPKGTKLALGKRRTGWTPSHPPQTKPPPRLNRTAELRKKSVGSSLEGESGPTPPGKTLPHAYPTAKPGFRRERERGKQRTYNYEILTL